MNEKLKITLCVLLGVVCAATLFCLVVAVGCSINGLTFGEQVCEWFSGNTDTIDLAGQVAEQIAENPIA